MDELDLGNGSSLPLYLDPDSFDSAVSGVVSAYDSLTKLLSSSRNTTTDDSDLGDSAVASACENFRRAWLTETELTAQAVGIIVQLLPRTKNNYQETDNSGGTGIGELEPQVPSPVPPVTEPSRDEPGG
ncbi:hypothetical protein [Nocardia sp. NPDC003345]